MTFIDDEPDFNYMALSELDEMREVVKVSLRLNVTHYHMWCPGCEKWHVVNQTWGFNGDRIKPTFTPSILVTMPPTDYRCHSFLTDGVWHYLSDCSHGMAGQSVPAVPWSTQDGA